MSSERLFPERKMKEVEEMLIRDTMLELLSESEVLVKEYCSIHAIPATIAAQGHC